MKAVIFSDGASSGNPGDAGAGSIIYYGDETHELSQYIGKTTNNVAEYSALILALRRASELKADSLEINLDSELIVKQVCGEYMVKSPHLYPLYRKVKSLLEGFKSYTIKYIPREMNKKADSLAKGAIKKRAGNVVAEGETSQRKVRAP